MYSDIEPIFIFFGGGGASSPNGLDRASNFYVLYSVLIIYLKFRLICTENNMIRLLLIKENRA
jgi:hypothetical protein